MQGNNFSTEGINKLLDVWNRQCTKLERLLIGAFLSDDIIPSFVELLKNNPKLEYISLACTTSYPKVWVTDTFIEEISPYLIGNVVIKHLSILYQSGITEKSVPILKDIASQSSIETLNIDSASVFQSSKDEILKLLQIPAKNRLIPVASNTKSAAKSSAAYSI